MKTASFRLLACAVTALSPIVVAAATAQTPNVLLLVADDLGIEQLASYGEGFSPAPTPQLDALAASGVRFANAFAYPTCSPTRACFHTGRRPFRHGIGSPVTNQSSPAGLPAAEWTLPEVLDAAASGYRHALVGKWHLGDATGAGLWAPNAAGWSHFAGSLQGAVPDYEAWRRVENGVARRSTDYATSRQVDDALEWIGRQTGPWFLVLSFNAPHTPLHAPPSHLHGQDLAGRSTTTDAGLFRDAMVEAMDAEIGRLLTGLGGTVRAATDVVFLGDNGSAPAVVEAPFDRRTAKGTVHRGGVQVPLLVAGPSVVGGGRVVTDPVEVVDLFPSLLALAGVDARATVPGDVVLDGIDFTPSLRDPQAVGGRRVQFAEQFGGNFDTAATVRSGDYKLLREESSVGGGGERFELYDLSVDPGENRDLLAGGGLDATAQRAYEDLRAALAQAREEAAVQSFGTGCGGALLRAPGAAPAVGGGLDYDLDGVPTGAALLILGLSRDTLADGTALPLSLSGFGWPGCALRVSIDDATPFVAGAAGADGRLVVPADPVLVGAVLQLQAATLLGVFSDGMTLVVGR